MNPFFPSALLLLLCSFLEMGSHGAQASLEFAVDSYAQSLLPSAGLTAHTPTPSMDIFNTGRRTGPGSINFMTEK